MPDRRSIIADLGERLRGGPLAPAVDAAAAGLFPPGSERTVLVSVVGVDPARLDEVIERAGVVLARHDRLVFLTDGADFVPFRSKRLPFEYLPPRRQRGGSRTPAEWARYLKARYGLILAKWQPLRVVSYGESIPAFLAAGS